MTLKEKFLNSPCELGYVNPNEYRAENNVKISDEYAIEFAEWCLISLLNGEEPKAETPGELLEIFKKEKGL